MSAKWYAIRVEAGREKAVAEALRLDLAIESGRPDLAAYLAVKDCEMVMPMTRGAIMRHGKKLEVCRPAIKGYIFRRMEMTAQAYYAICGTDEAPGIAGVVGFLPKGKPLPIDEAEIDKLTNACKERFGQSAEDQDLGWMVGKVFPLISGPYQSFSGECLRIDQTAKVPVLLISCFGRLVPRETPLSEIDLENFQDPVADAEKTREERRAAKAQKKKRHRRIKGLGATHPAIATA